MFQLFSMIYYLLQTISTAILTTVATVWYIEEALIEMMMSCFFYVLSWACNPLLVLPTLLATYIVIKSMCARPCVQCGGGGGAKDKYEMRNRMRTPRMNSYRSNGSMSSRSNDSGDMDINDYRKSI